MRRALLDVSFAVTALSVVFAIAACTPFGPGDIRDARVVSVEPTSIGRVPSISGFGNLPPETPLFLVEFTTDVDLKEFAQQGVNFHSRIFVGIGPCSERSPKILRYSKTAEDLLSVVEVYDGEGNIVSGFETRSQTVRQSSQSYHLYFGVRLSGKDDFFSTYFGGKPEPICFVLDNPSGRIFGPTYTSNIVTIPEDAIRSAIMQR
jgi:hypothetical protein